MDSIAWSQGIGRSTWANWRTSFIIGACLLLGGNGGVTISEQYIDSGLAALIVAIVPIYIVLLGWATGNWVVAFNLYYFLGFFLSTAWVLASHIYRRLAADEEQGRRLALLKQELKLRG